MIAQLLWNNPLLTRRLARSTAYTVANLFLVTCIVLCLRGALVRYGAIDTPKELGFAMPWEWPKESAVVDHDSNLVHIGATSEELEGFRAQILGIFGALMFLAWRLIAGFFRLPRLGRLLHDTTLRLSSLSAPQVVMAIHDWPMLKGFAVLMACLGTLLTPDRGLYESEPYFGTYGGQATSDTLLAGRTMVCAAIILMIHRIVPLVVYFNSPSTRAAVTAGVMILILPVFMIFLPANQSGAIVAAAFPWLVTLLTWAALHPALPMWRWREE